MVPPLKINNSTTTYYLAPRYYKLRIQSRCTIYIPFGERSGIVDCFSFDVLQHRNHPWNHTITRGTTQSPVQTSYPPMGTFHGYLGLSTGNWSFPRVARGTDQSDGRPSSRFVTGFKKQNTMYTMPNTRPYRSPKGLWTPATRAITQLELVSVLLPIPEELLRSCWKSLLFIL